MCDTGSYSKGRTFWSPFEQFCFFIHGIHLNLSSLADFDIDIILLKLPTFLGNFCKRCQNLLVKWFLACGDFLLVIFYDPRLLNVWYQTVLTDKSWIFKATITRIESLNLAVSHVRWKVQISTMMKITISKLF